MEQRLWTRRNFQPEVILLDIGLPGMSGYEVAQSLRAEPWAEGIIIAAITGYGQESDRQRSWDSGFDYHLTKPPDPDVLQSLLASPRLRTAPRLVPAKTIDKAKQGAEDHIIVNRCRHLIQDSRAGGE